MVYGIGICLPAEFFLPSDREANSDFVTRLKKRINDIKPRPVTRHGTKRTFVFKELRSSPYVFLRHDAARGPSQPPYDGPYEVMERGDKNFIIKINGKNVRVTIDRLKPAFLLSEDLEHSPEDSVRTHEETTNPRLKQRRTKTRIAKARTDLLYAQAERSVFLSVYKPDSINEFCMRLNILC
ncbi:pro-pol polyprotein [Lasius niger]|uniref:Pro-pol polyprotein n=1 Tax=Lasius niger TaxID=67767 RepID=A0A0J7K390_LASNI|nr:pro-pol polyprotein [Lasius niger]